MSDALAFYHAPTETSYYKLHQSVRKTMNRPKEEAKSTAARLSALRGDPKQRLDMSATQAEMAARARRRALARGRLSTRQTWTSPSGQLKTNLGG